MEDSRTKNVIRNVTWTVPLHIVFVFLQFFSRTIFVRQLGKEYLGINGLFSDIIWMISLAEMGILDAIIISMYKPLQEKNYDKVRALLNFSKKAYSIIGLIVLALGLIIIPLLPTIIKEPPNISENLIIIFLLYLFQAVITYYVIYKRSIIFADQKDYLINIYQKIFQFIQIIIQIIILLKTNNFYIFLSIQVICTLVMNFMTSLKAEKKYPFIKTKNTYKLNKEEISEIIVNTKAMFLYVIGSTSLLGIDSILVSSIVGIGILGLCSNYMLIINAIRTLIQQITKGFTASIGNLNINENQKESEGAFNEVSFVVFFIAGYFSVNLALSLNSLISVWFDTSFLVAQSVLISLVLRFYIQNTQYAPFTFRSTMGLLKKWKFIPVITAIVNITLSIIMGYIIGVAGIFHASSLATFLFTILPETFLLYKLKFNKSIVQYLFRYFGYLLFLAGNYFITSRLLELFSFEGWIGFFSKAGLGALFSGLIFIIVFFRDKNFRTICSRIIYIIKYKN